METLSTKITAILCVRNEELYLDVVLVTLAACGIQLAVIDNDSTDRTGADLRKLPCEDRVPVAASLPGRLQPDGTA